MCVRQFEHMRKHSLEIMHVHNEKFQQIHERLMAKPYNPLDHKKQQFEKDFTEFFTKIEALEREVRLYMAVYTVLNLLV